MNGQEIFDHVASHLKQQGRKSQRQRASGQMECLYRSPDGCKCAAGCLIPDDLYDPDMEGKNIRAVVTNFPLPDFFKDEINLIDFLQQVHDGYDVASWPYQLSLVAKRFQLEYQL